MSCKKAAIKPTSRLLRESSCACTPLAKQVYFEEETQTGPQAVPQAKKRCKVQA